MVVKERRLKAGLSQEDLAYEAGLHPCSISFMERGMRAPTIYSIFAIAKALKTKPSNLVSDVSSLNPDA